MVFRALMVGWVLVLGGWCWGQEGQLVFPSAHDPEAVLDARLRFVTDVHAVGDERVQFTAHKCYWVSTPEPRDNSPVASISSFYGHVISARNGDRVDILWASQSVVPLYFNASSRGHTFPVLHWDHAERQLWVALIGTTNETKSRVVVWRLDVERDTDSGALSVGAAARMQQDFTHEPKSFGPMFVSAARFASEDGRLVLNLYHHDRAKTRIEPEGQMEPSEYSLEGAQLSEDARTAIQQTVRAEVPLLSTPWPALNIERETGTVEVDGKPARFVMHRANATETSSRTGDLVGPGYVVSIVPREETKPTTLWKTRAPTTEIHIPLSVFGVFDERTAMWWDDRGQRLWVATAFTSGKGPQVITVNCLGVRRDDATGEWSIGSLCRARGQYTRDEMNAPDAAMSEFGPPPLITSMRFIRAEDGGINLEVEHPEGDPTILDLPRTVEDYPSVTKPRISELLVDLIREDLAERGGDGE